MVIGVCLATLIALYDRGVDSSSKANLPDFLDAVPSIRVSDMARSLQFYQDVLGFRSEWLWPFDRLTKTHVSMRRGAVKLFLTYDPSPNSATMPPTTSAAIFVSHLSVLHAELKESAAKFGIVIDEPKIFPWGLAEIHVRDPDGHVIRFCDETSGLPAQS